MPQTANIPISEGSDFLHVRNVTPYLTPKTVLFNFKKTNVGMIGNVTGYKRKPNFPIVVI